MTVILDRISGPFFVSRACILNLLGIQWAPNANDGWRNWVDADGNNIRGHDKINDDKYAMDTAAAGQH